MIIMSCTPTVLVHKLLQNYRLPRFLLQSIASYRHVSLDAKVDVVTSFQPTRVL